MMFAVMASRTRVHDDNPDPRGRGDRRALRKAPVSGDVIPMRRRHVDDDDEGPSAEDLERFGNPTRECPECGKDVFDDSAVCYHCGHAFERSSDATPTHGKLWVVLTVVVLVGLFVLGAVSGIF